MIANNNGDNLLHMVITNRSWIGETMAYCDKLNKTFRFIPGGAQTNNTQEQTPYALLKADNSDHDYVIRRLLLLLLLLLVGALCPHYGQKKKK